MASDGPEHRPPIRDAATILVIRETQQAPSVLMGQRGKDAAFLPDRLVFPGGALEPADWDVPFARPLAEPCRRRLAAPGAPTPEAIAAAGIRELFEETGQIAGRPGEWADPPEDWRAFARSANRPDAGALRFVFRAVTPPGRPRRFDARIFAMAAEHLASDPDDFSRAGGELSHLRWIPVREAATFPLPFVTRLALAEVAARLPDLAAPPSVPCLRHTPGPPWIEWIA